MYPFRKQLSPIRAAAAFLAIWQFVLTGHIVYVVQNFSDADPLVVAAREEQAVESCQMMDNCEIQLNSPTNACCCYPGDDGSENRGLSDWKIGPTDCGDTAPQALTRAANYPQMHCPDTTDSSSCWADSSWNRPDNDTIRDLLPADMLDKVPLLDT